MVRRNPKRSKFYDETEANEIIEDEKPKNKMQVQEQQQDRDAEQVVMVVKRRAKKVRIPEDDDEEEGGGDEGKVHEKKQDELKVRIKLKGGGQGKGEQEEKKSVQTEDAHSKLEANYSDYNDGVEIDENATEDDDGDTTEQDDNENNDDNEDDDDDDDNKDDDERQAALPKLTEKEIRRMTSRQKSMLGLAPSPTINVPLMATSAAGAAGGAHGKSRSSSDVPVQGREDPQAQANAEADADTKRIDQEELEFRKQQKNRTRRMSEEKKREAIRMATIEKVLRGTSVKKRKSPSGPTAAAPAPASWGLETMGSSSVDVQSAQSGDGVSQEEKMNSTAAVMKEVAQDAVRTVSNKTGDFVIFGHDFDIHSLRKTPVRPPVHMERDPRTGKRIKAEQLEKCHSCPAI